MSLLGLFKDKAKIVLSSWGEAPENAILTQLLHQFEKGHPHIQVELEVVPFAEYFSRLQAQFREDKGPDVVFVSSQAVVDFRRLQLLEPLTSYEKADPDVILDAFYPSTVESFTIHGDLFALPRDIAPVCVVYYNKKAFDQADLPYPKEKWTTDEFLSDAKALTKREGGNTERWGFVEDFPLPENWIYAFGGRFVDDPHQPKRYQVDKPEFLNGIQFRADLMNKHRVMPRPSDLSLPGALDPTSLFTSGKAAMFLSGIWKTPLFRGIQDFSWDINLSPRVPWVPQTVPGGSSGYGIAKTSKHKKEAWELIAFLSSAGGQRQLASTGLIQPALEAVADSAAFIDGKDPLNKKFLLLVPAKSLDDPLAANWMEVKRGVIFPGLERVWNGEETAPNAIARLKSALLNYPIQPVA